MRILGKKLTIKKPSYTMISLAQLHYDEYQRIHDKYKIDKIAKNIDWDIFGTILVSYRDGKYWVVDGQHRVEAIRRLDPDAEVPATVWTGLTYEEEAEKFLKLNTERKALNCNQKFHALIEKGDKSALTILKVLNENGLSFNKNSGFSKNNVVGAIHVIQRIYATEGARGLDRVLKIVKTSWLGEGCSLKRDVIYGVATFIHNYPEVDDKILCDVLSKTDTKALLLQAQFLAQSEQILIANSGASRYVHVAKAIRDLYNKNVDKKDRVA